MKPVIISPVPVILFKDGLLTVEAAYRSATGAPMQDATISLVTSKATLACDVIISGDSITGTLRQDALQTGDSSFVIGNSATIVVRTNENGSWSETRYTAKTAANPTISISSGTGNIISFPWAITWKYSDYSGFYQNKWELRIKGNLFGDVALSDYSISNKAVISGNDIAFASDIDGTAEKLICELEVWSTSGLSSVVEFELGVTREALEVTASARFADGKMTVSCSENEFYLFVLNDDELTECGYSESGLLVFDLPIKDARYFVVTVDDNRIGSAKEVFPTGKLGSPRLDYPYNGVKNSIILLLDNEEDFSLSNSISYENFLGRENPVGYFQNSTKTQNVSAYFKKPFNTKKILNSLRGTEAVYRPSEGGIYRVMVDSAKFTNERSYDIAGQLDLSLTEVAGSPYNIFYNSKQFIEIQLYPAEDVFPSSSTWTVA